MSDKRNLTAGDRKMRLENLSAQATALSMMLFGEGGEAFRNMHDHQQDNVLWLLSDLLHEMDTIVNRRRA